jgi:serine/threonine-protein kinase HipA
VFARVDSGLMTMADPHVEVYVELGGETILAGELWSHRRRGRESATFSYATAYLELDGAYELDPALPLFGGRLQTADGRALFGAFTDCAPDRWGRRLIARARRRAAQGEGETEGSLGEIDYLLGVRDDMRQGALRFREPGETRFLADELTGVPMLTDLPTLLSASERIERDEALDEDLEALLHGGSSLGGARPKAHVVGEDGQPAIAKFPRPDGDDWEVMRWEAVALELAGAAGIRVPSFRLVEIDGSAILVVDRFDRNGLHERIGYVSAMTMLEAGDGDTGSYLDIADTIETHSPAASADLRQLWRRIAFSILISNTDDHLRNHGFLRSSTAGWSLSPAFDLNPDPAPGARQLSTAIDFDRTEARIETLIEVAPGFRLDEDGARAVLAEVGAATAGWRRVAVSRGLKPPAIEEMAPAFEHEQAEAAARIGSGAAA